MQLAVSVARVSVRPPTLGTPVKGLTLFYLHIPIPRYSIFRKLIRPYDRLWSSGQSSWLQFRRFQVRFPALQKKVVGLDRGPPSLVSATEVLLGSNSSGSGLESRGYGRRDSSRWPRGILYPQKLVLTSLPSGGRSVGIVRLRTEAMEFFFYATLLQHTTACRLSHQGETPDCGYRNVLLDRTIEHSSGWWQINTDLYFFQFFFISNQNYLDPIR
jgi:hypothetical protein